MEALTTGLTVALNLGLVWFLALVWLSLGFFSFYFTASLFCFIFDLSQSDEVKIITKLIGVVGALVFALVVLA